MLGETLRQVVEQQLQDLGLARGAFRQRAQHLALALVEHAAPLGELAGEVLVGLDPLPEIQRLKPHGEAPRAVEKRAVTHGASFAPASASVKPGEPLTMRPAG